MALRIAFTRVAGTRALRAGRAYRVGSRVLLGAAALLLLAQHAHAQPRRGAIYFQVIDTSVNPLAGAEVVLPHLGLAMQVPEEGALLLKDVPDGVYLVQARHLGYKTEWQVVRVSGDTVRAHFMLLPAARALDTVSVVADAGTVEGPLRDFLRRRTSSPSGYFLTRADVERRRPADFGGLVQNVSGIVVQRAGAGPTVLRSRRSADSRCAGGMLVFVDGVLQNSPTALGGSRQRLPREDSLALRRPRPGGTAPGGSLGGGSARRGTRSGGVGALAGDPVPSIDAAGGANTSSLFDVNEVPVSAVVAVEVYPTLAGVPAEFRLPGAECGVVLVWTAG